MLLVGAVLLLLLDLVDPTLGLVLVCLAAVAEVVEVWFWIRYLRRFRVRTGAEGMIGETARVVEPCLPEGTVRLRGEIWSARSLSGAATGERVEVLAVDGLTLEVE